jgi:hypothetical protein
VRPTEKMSATPAYRLQPGTFPSPVSDRESQKYGVFEGFLDECSRVSLRPRLYGGGCSLLLTLLCSRPIHMPLRFELGFRSKIGVASNATSTRLFRESSRSTRLYVLWKKAQRNNCSDTCLS